MYEAPLESNRLKLFAKGVVEEHIVTPTLQRNILGLKAVYECQPRIYRHMISIFLSMTPAVVQKRRNESCLNRRGSLRMHQQVCSKKMFVN